MASISGGIDYESGKNREWLVANGLGGYASSTIVGANTRKYHGLLIASKNPPVERRLLLSKLEETAKIGGKEFQLSTNKYPGVVYPRGYESQTSFSLSPFPVFEYSLPGATIRKTIFMVHGKNATIVRYEVYSTEPVEFSIVPLTNDRDFHSNTNFKISFSQGANANGTVIRTNGKPVLLLESDLCSFLPSESWYVNMLYELETERGEGDSDNHFSPGAFSIKINGHSTFHIIASDGAAIHGNPDSLYRTELVRMKALSEKMRVVPEQLAYSADSFLVKRRSTHSGSIIAGYHWFADWGRDSTISLPGLALCTGKFDFARSVLDTFAQKTSNGLVPNVFSDTGEGASYNSADASLWFILASYKYLEKTEDEAFFRERLWGKLKEIVHAYKNGTSGVHMEQDFLISCGPGLTWMDAFVDGRPVTPRNGKPVEINALWCNALEIMHVLANRFNEGALAHEINGLSDGARKSFGKFWNEEKKCLYDTLDPIDASIRPNQVFSISLPLQILEREKENSILETVRQELFTPYGLRSLSPSDPKYKGSYYGDRRDRDNAYHNGAIWSWLIGPYADACAKIKGTGEASKLIKPLKDFIEEKGMGTVPELFDSENLKPRGCFSQAWGVAEWLRVMLEYGAQ
ncbi:MAG: amylo-alpha-1,6-glucosidase [Candidatus Micrarchaeota archaeon]